MSVTELARVNGITNANLLTPGQYLAVPALGSYSNFSGVPQVYYVR